MCKRRIRGLYFHPQDHEYFAPDFRKWKDHDLYLDAFTGRISDLKVSGSQSRVDYLRDP